MRKTLIALPAAALMPLLGSVPASADIGGLAVAPAHFDPNNPATRAYFILNVAPGGTASDQVRVGNTSQKTLHLYVSAVDGLTGQTSGVVYANREDPVNEDGAWVSTAVSTLEVAPVTSTLVSFTVRVPAGARPGDHLAGIAVEDANPTTAGSGLQVTTVVRAVVGVLVKVPGPAVANAEVVGWSIGPLNDQSNSSTVFVDLTDTGGLLVKPKLTVDLSGPDGYHSKHSRQLDTILPGDAIHYPFPWPDTLVAGDYSATITADSSTLTSTFHLGARLSGTAGLPTPVPAVATTQPAPSTSWEMPVIAGLVAANLLFAAVVVLLLRRRGRRDREPRLSVPTISSER